MLERRRSFGLSIEPAASTTVTVKDGQYYLTETVKGREITVPWDKAKANLGKGMAFEENQRRLFVLKSRDLKRQETLELSRNRVLTAHPTFSPDGSTIAFFRTFEGGHQVFVISADGSGSPRQLTPRDEMAVMPSWSRGDGQHVYYYDNRFPSPGPPG